MKNALLLFISILFFQFVSAQQKEIDSINQVLFQIKSDSLREQKLRKLIIYYRKTNLDNHWYLTNLALEKSIKKNDVKRIGYWYRELGRFYSNKGDLDSAFIYYEKASQKFKSINDLRFLHMLKNTMALGYQKKGDYPNAIKNYNAVISYFEKLEGKKNQRNALSGKMNLAGIYDELNDNKTRDSINLEIYNDPYTKIDSSFLASACINLVYSKSDLGEYDKALLFADEAERVVTNLSSIANLYSSRAGIYFKKKNYRKADFYYRKALKKNQEINNLRGATYAKQNIANNLVEWGKYREAEKMLLVNSLELKQSEDIYLIKKNYFSLSELYSKTNRYKDALRYFKHYERINDSILNIEKQKYVKEYETLYKTERLKNEKALVEQEVILEKNKRNQNRIIYISIIVVITLFLCSLLVYLSRAKALKKAEIISIELKESQKRLAIEKQYRNSELKALKAQMNPHFIFNALNSIQDYIVLNQKKLASDYLGKFADLIRNYLHFSDIGFISVLDETHNLNLYLELEKLRFEDVLEYSFRVEEEANSDSINIPTMLIQPYIENALKHGLLHKKGNRKLIISIRKVSDKIIECIIEDNGIGREKSKEINLKRKSQHKSFALKATTERLDLLNYGRDKKIGVDIIDLQEDNQVTGTKVILKIPILKK